MKDTLIKATSRQGFDRVFALSGRLTALLALTLASVWPARLVAEEVVNVYSARHYDTDMALYEEFTRQTGIKVNLIEGGSDALIERIVNEGEFTPADMLITVDAGRLWRASEKNIFQPVESQVMDQRVPANLRDPDGLWFGLSKRVRAIAYNKAAGLPIEVMRYEDLANPALTDSVCMRSSSNIYNLSLMGSIIEAAGEAAAEAWAAGVVKNFARKPQGNDRAQVKAIWAGECDISIGNTYYMGAMLSDAEQKEWADSVQILFPTFENGGTHINISGVAMAKHAPNPENALAFMEFLTSAKAQEIYAEANHEYPVAPGSQASALVQTWGDFDPDQVNLMELAKLRGLALRLTEAVDFDG